MPPRYGKVRKYKPGDRADVRHICCETALMGEPLEKFWIGREPFADLWSAYWTDHEPESCFVAEVDGRVVGYLLGCTDTEKQERITFKKMGPGIISKLFTTGSIFNRKTSRYLYQTARSAVRGELKTPNFKKEYPAHLHTNLINGFRGLGLGRELMNQYFSYLRSKRVYKCHLGTTTYNKQAIPFYMKFGFKELYKSPVTMWEGIIDEPVSLLFMGIKLDKG